MAPDLGHPEGCGCAVCRRRRDELERYPRAREVAASEDPTPVPPQTVTDPDPATSEAPAVEHHEHVTERHAHPTRVERERTVEVRTREVRTEHVKHRRHGGILGKVLIVAFVLWLLHSFYPNLNVPLVPGIGYTCAPGGGQATAVGLRVPGPSVVPLPGLGRDGLGGEGLDGLPDTPLGKAWGLGGKLGDLAQDTIGGAVKKVALSVVGAGLHAAGATVREMASHPPTVEGIRTGLRNDAETVGRVVGFVGGAFSGRPMGDIVSSTDAGVADGGCGPCPGAVPARTGGLDGVDVAARAALRAGWTGEDAVMAVAVAGPESGYRHDAANPSSTARGMWQTMMSYHAPKYRGAAWDDPYANARVAHQIWADAGGWSPWVGYTSGAYRQDLTEARTAVRAATATCQGGGGAGGEAVVSEAAKYLGVPYVWGGTNGATGLDCSGLIQLVYKNLGVDLPRVSYQQARAGTAVATLAAAQPGDILAFGSPVHHVALYMGDGRMIEAPRPGKDVRVSAVYATPSAIRRVLPASTAVPVSTGATGRGFALASFNILGTSHTGVRSSDARLPRAVRALARHRVDVVGFQEMQSRQAAQFDRATGGTFGRFSARGDTDNSIAWRRDTFTLDRAYLVAVPYFEGQHRRMPVVRLRYRPTGQAMWFLNVHNPADTRQHHNQGRYRAAALRVEARMLARLRATGDPVYWTGDMNARGVFHSAATRAGMRSAMGSGYRGIDWIMGANTARFGPTTVDDSSLVDAASDHPLVVARIPANRGEAS